MVLVVVEQPEVGARADGPPHRHLADGRRSDDQQQLSVIRAGVHGAEVMGLRARHANRSAGRRDRADTQTSQSFNGMWVDPAHDPRDTDEPPVGEKVILRQYLDRYRTTLEMKCEGLTPEQLATRSVAPSTMSLLGLVRHLASVEHHWFRRVLEGQEDLPLPLDRGGPRPRLRRRGRHAGVRRRRWASWRREVAHAREVYERSDDLGETHDDPYEVRGVRRAHDRGVRRHAGHADLLARAHRRPDRPATRASVAGRLRRPSRP